MKFPPPHRGWTSGRATPSIPTPTLQEAPQTRQNDTYRNAETLQMNGASSIHSRKIVASDLDAVARLLTKAFGYSHEYFPQLLCTLTQHSTPIGFPKYGYVLLSDDVIVGAILTIFSTIGSGAVRSIRCHVTSWSVNPSYRHFAALFFSKALSHKHVTYLKIS